MKVPTPAQLQTTWIGFIATIVITVVVTVILGFIGRKILLRLGARWLKNFAKGRSRVLLLHTAVHTRLVNRKDRTGVLAHFVNQVALLTITQLLVVISFVALVSQLIISGVSQLVLTGFLTAFFLLSSYACINSYFGIVVPYLALFGSILQDEKEKTKGLPLEEAAARMIREFGTPAASSAEGTPPADPSPAP